MTAYHLIVRIGLLQKYLETLGAVHAELSNYNLEFGEGNPDAAISSQIIDEYSDELLSLTDKAKNTVVD